MGLGAKGMKNGLGSFIHSIFQLKIDHASCCNAFFPVSAAHWYGKKSAQDDTKNDHNSNRDRNADYDDDCSRK